MDDFITLQSEQSEQSPVHSEIIKCKDCAHYDGNRCEMHEYLHFKENDFCSYAERKN